MTQRSLAAAAAFCLLLVAPMRAARTFDLTTASIADINAAFDAGALTSERLTELYLARIAAYDKSGADAQCRAQAQPQGPGRGARARDVERRARVLAGRCTAFPFC